MSDGRPRSRWWPVLLLLLVSAGATAATVAAYTTRQPGTIEVVVSTSPRVSVSLPATSTAAPATTSAGPQPTVTTGTLPLAPGAPSTAATTTAPPPVTTTTRPPAPAAPAIRSWPRGHSGYTVVLQSLPESEGRGAALAQAQRAHAAGIAAVGVLLSSDFGSLRAGYWVVFAGAFASPAAAQSASAADRGRGFAGAYPARVSP